MYKSYMIVPIKTITYGFLKNKKNIYNILRWTKFKQHKTNTNTHIHYRNIFFVL